MTTPPSTAEPAGSGHRPFRFGTGAFTVEDWVAFCRSSEEQGFDTVLVPDHLGAPSPFAMLGTAAAVTSRVRLGTLVVNNEFWNPALLAREAATVDRISGGRLELGLGCGHMKSEFDDAGIPWRPHAERVAGLERGIDAVDRLFADQEPRPEQHPRPPLLIGAHGERALDLAARRADIVGFSGLTQIRGRKMGTFSVAGPDETLRRVDFLRERAGSRLAELEFQVLVQAVVVTDDAEREAAELVRTYGENGLDSVRTVLDNPFVLVGTAEEIAAEIVANRERFGFSYVTTHGPSRDGLAEVIPHVRRLAGEERSGAPG